MKLLHINISSKISQYKLENKRKLTIAKEICIKINSNRRFFVKETIKYEKKQIYINNSTLMLKKETTNTKIFAENLLFEIKI